MPFQKKALEKLLEREGLSERGLAQEISTHCTENGRRAYITNQTINSWRNKSNQSPKSSSLDLLYMYAKSKGHEDLEFYEPPK
tara:strand:+ start:50 stop:298 length:249 start_codon:yes stop_codon:yes gene_type:complete